ncbi:MAG TPA: pyocin knob domain-containing protein [Methylophilaceae bacterium]
MSLKLSNNASGILAMAISDSATSLTLRSGHGSRFPALGPEDWFPIAVVRASDPMQFEIMRCIARTLDTLTVERAQEGTAAITFSAGDVVELRLTAGTLEENFPQVEGRNAKNLRFSVDSVGGKPELKFKSGYGEETVVRQSDIEDVVRQSDIEDVVRSSELGTAATHDVTTSPTDTTDGRVLTVGSLGLGNPITLTSSDDLNNIRSPGIYRHTGGNAPANTPIPGAGIVTVFRGAPSGFVVQVWLDRGGQRNFQRAFNNDTGVWSSWVEFYSASNIDKLISDANLVQTSRTISPGTGLTGGGDLSANRTISIATSHIPIGVGQTWRDVTSSRSTSTIYTNTVGRPIYVAITMGAGGIAEVSEDGTNWVSVWTAGATGSSCSFIVPAGYRYRYRTTNSSFVYWAELR